MNHWRFRNDGSPLCEDVRLPPASLVLNESPWVIETQLTSRNCEHMAEWWRKRAALAMEDM